jgi:hypothetical protein
VTYQAMCSQVWLDVSADSRISGEIDSRGDVQFTIRCGQDEFELVFPPPMLRQFVDLATGLLPPADQAGGDTDSSSTAME